MTGPIRIVQSTWKHTCLRAPGHEGKPVTLILPGVGGCRWCGDPGPDEQKKIDATSEILLRITSQRHTQEERFHGDNGDDSVFDGPIPF